MDHGWNFRGIFIPSGRLGPFCYCDGNSSVEAEAHSSYWVGMRLVFSEAANCPAVSSTQVVAARISPQKSFLSQHWTVGSACPVGTRCSLHCLPSFLPDSNPVLFTRSSHCRFFGRQPEPGCLVAKQLPRCGTLAVGFGISGNCGQVLETM